MNQVDERIAARLHEIIEDIEFVASKEQNPVLMVARILELCSYRAEVATPHPEGLQFHLPLRVE